MSSPFGDGVEKSLCCFSLSLVVRQDRLDRLIGLVVPVSTVRMLKGPQGFLESCEDQLDRLVGLVVPVSTTRALKWWLISVS